MKSIFGYTGRNDAPLDLSLGNKGLIGFDYWNAKAQKSWKNQTTFLCGLSAPLEHLDDINEDLIASEGDLIVLADANLFNKEELQQQLSVSQKSNSSASRLILESYMKWGRDCPNYLNGEFAFAIYDQNTNEVFLARDHHGIKPLYYSANEEYFSFASEMKGLLSLPFVSKDIDHQYVADYICRIWLDNTQTLYRNIKRFPAAHWAVIGQDSFQLHSYWQPENFQTISYQKETDYVDAFEEKIIRAVERRTHDSPKLGTELSGGLDSSLVSALLSKSKVNKCSAYSYVLPPHLEGKGLFSDREKVNEIAQHLAFNSLEFLTDEGRGMLDSLAWNLKVQDEPPFEFNPLFRDGLYQKMQAKGQRTLFSGFGGDEMVSSQSSGYLKQLYLERKKSLLKEEIKAISNRKGKPDWLLYSSLYLKLLCGDRFLANAVNTFQSFRGKESILRKKLNHRPLLKEWFKQLNMEDRFNAYQKRYTRNGNFIEDQIRRMQEPHVSMRLEYQAKAARSFQVDYRYPLLDVELIEFYLGLPTELKARNGKGRYIFKKVMERHLPKNFVWGETKKGSSNPQVLSRTLKDGKELEEKLFSIEASHPIWHYLDEKKLRSNRIEFKDWNMSTTDFGYLILADKLEQQ